MKSSDLIKLLEQEGWVHSRTNGSHHNFKHPDRSNLITVPHPEKDLPKGTSRKILKQAGIKP